MVGFAKSSTESPKSASPPKSNNCKEKVRLIYDILGNLEIPVFCNSKKHSVDLVSNEIRACSLIDSQWQPLGNTQIPLGLRELWLAAPDTSIGETGGHLGFKSRSRGTISWFSLPQV